MLTRLVLITAAMMATSSAANAGVVEAMRFKGTQAFTFFDGTVDIDCGGGVPGTFFAQGSIQAANQVMKTKGVGRTVNNGVFVFASFFNSCTGEFRFLEGTAPDIFDQPNITLRSAAIDGVVSVQDFSDGATFLLDLDVEFEADGPRQGSRSIDHSRTQATPGGPVTIRHTMSANATRPATVSGTIILAGVEMTPTWSSTNLVWNANSNLVIER